MAEEKLYYIWSFDLDGWRQIDVGSCVEDIHAAGKFTLEQAERICRDANHAFHTGYAEMPNVAMVPVES